MIKFIKRYYIQIIAVGALFLLIILMIVQSVSVLGMIKNKSVEFKQVELDYLLAEDFLNGIHKFKQSVEYISDDNKWLQVLLPNDDDQKVQLFAFLEELAVETGNNKIVLSMGTSAAPVAKIKKSDPVTEESDAMKLIVDNYMNIDITLIGEYDDLIYFLHKLENIKYFSSILSLNIVKTNADAYQEQGSVDVKNNLLKTTMSVAFYLEDNK